VFSDERSTLKVSRDFIIKMWRRLGQAGIGIVLLLPGVWGCDRTNQDSSTSQSPSLGPRDGIGQRLGTDVTAQPSRTRDAPQEDIPKIVAFGDSLTAGAGISAEESYPAQLQRRLDENGYRYRVINAGVSGDTTAGGLRRIDWVLKSRPKIVILELGGNDGLRGLSLDQMRDNLDRIVQRVQATGASVILTGMKLPLNYGEAYRSTFESVYSELAQAHRLTLMPFFLEGVGSQTTLNQADGIHPTGKGYRVVVNNLWPVLAPLLTKDSELRPTQDGKASASAGG
jgi:acyl-CoA thioesterase-1